MKTVSITIEGTTPYLMHRFGEAAEVEGQKQTRRIAIQEEEQRKAAERVAYRDSARRIYFPGAAIARLLREAGGSHKQKGSRKSVKYIVPAAVLVCDDTILGSVIFLRCSPNGVACRIPRLWNGLLITSQRSGQ